MPIELAALWNAAFDALDANDPDMVRELVNELNEETGVKYPTIMGALGFVREAHGLECLALMGPITEDEITEAVNAI